MISYQEASLLLQTKIIPLQDRAYALLNTYHHIASETVRASFPLPSFRNSAMDGFAVVAAETSRASINMPVTLKNKMTLLAGDIHQAQHYPAFSACEIMTGARVPDGFDAVVPVEEVGVLRDAHQIVTNITLKNPITKKQNIREPGEDFSQGDVILRKGDRITAAHIMALSALGRHTIRVLRPLKIALLATGNEVINDLHCPLQSGQIYDSNMPYLQTALKEFPVELSTFYLREDSMDAFVRMMDTIEAAGADIIISIGAVSMGSVDFIPAGLVTRHANIIFHRVAIKPGKPILFAERRPHQFFFGLPGNPVSTAVGLRFFVIPFLRHLFGLPAEKPVMARLTHTSKKKNGLQFFLKGNLSVNDEGICQATILPGQESFKIHPLLIANGWISLASSLEHYEEGQLVSFFQGV